MYSLQAVIFRRNADSSPVDQRHKDFINACIKDIRTELEGS